MKWKLLLRFQAFRFFLPDHHQDFLFYLLLAHFVSLRLVLVTQLLPASACWVSASQLAIALRVFAPLAIQHCETPPDIRRSAISPAGSCFDIRRHSFHRS